MKTLLLYFFSHRTLAVVRWDFHFLLVRVTNRLSLRKRRVTRQLAQTTPRFLNLGSGPRGISSSDWFNVDGWADTNVHLAIDFNRPLPFPNNCFEGVFSEHVFEHFNPQQGQSLLRECLRVLRPGGCLRLIVPDGEKLLRTYIDNPSELVGRRNGNGEGFAMDAVNSYFRQRYEHQFIYDWQTLEDQLRRAGFAELTRVTYQQGKASKQIAALDDVKYAWESLYVEAVKPAHLSPAA
ncbi:MAG: hypothetical protein QOF62_377 [Pyrinomonadaceae bacterium]|jgi:predicted SAM-dependent methyltransferase|nr:hypothetical protein [Pyrinomonadaceae bacterium]